MCLCAVNLNDKSVTLTSLVAEYLVIYEEGKEIRFIFKNKVAKIGKED
jgi:hypothetical protein